MMMYMRYFPDGVFYFGLDDGVEPDLPDMRYRGRGIRIEDPVPHYPPYTNTCVRVKTPYTFCFADKTGAGGRVLTLNLPRGGKRQWARAKMATTEVFSNTSTYDNM